MAEEKKFVQQRVSLGGQGTNIIINHTAFSPEGFAIGQKTALVEIDMLKNPIDVFQNAAKMEWNLFGAKNQGGFVQAAPVRPLTEEEIAGTKAGNRSYTAVIEQTINDEDLVHGTNESLRPEPMRLPVLK